MLRVDNQPTVTALAPGAFTQTSFDTNLYIGGIDDIDLLSREMAVKNSFSGDIQRVRDRKRWMEEMRVRSRKGKLKG